jgi:amidase
VLGKAVVNPVIEETAVADRDLCFTPAASLLRLYRSRKASPLEVMQAVLAQIDAVNPRVNAYVTVAREQALAAARRATTALGKRGASLPPLHGVPVSIKDLTPTKGIRTTWGSKIFEHHVPNEDALYVARLKAAGAIVVGKTNTPEFGAGGNTFNAVFGATRIPWNPALTCGGSSGGAAVALATGMGPLAQGSDLGGSLRTPAAFCGVVGFRTSVGLIPVYPADLGWDSLSVTGPMARTVGDVALMLSVMAGPDDRAPLSYDVDVRRFTAAVARPSVKGWRAAFTPDLDGLIPVDQEVAAVAERAAGVFRSLGVRVERGSPDFGEVNEIVLATRGLSMVARHADKLAEWEPVMQKGLVWNIKQGLSLTPEQIGQGEKLRTRLWHRVREFMATRDLLLLPTVAVPPFPVEQRYPTEINGKPLDNYTQWFFLTYGITVTGLPAISLPCGFTRSGLPVGLQIVGRRHQEAAVLRAAAAFEAAHPWAAARPPVLSATA